LSKIYKDYNTIEARNYARKYLLNAIWLDPYNTEYRLLYASLQEYFGRAMALNEYRKITELDPDCVEAWYNMGRLKEEEYYEYHNSVFKEGDSPELSYAKYADEDFTEAEIYFLKTLSLDGGHKDAKLHLAFLYEEAGLPEKGIPYLKEAKIAGENIVDLHLYLGLLYYKSSKLKEALLEYQSALKLMNESEYRDFSFNSVKKLLEPVLGDVLEKSSEQEIKNIIDVYWRTGDPLILTGYNERILEHYSRVAYANLRFGVPKKNIIGWKTDRGEALLRYGEPLFKTRYRPHLEAGGKSEVFMKTDVWNYGSFELGFSDQYMSGNYRFTAPEAGSFFSQYNSNSHEFMNHLRKARLEIYNPKFEGPAFSAPFIIAQFRNKEERVGGFTDVYAAYALEAPDSSFRNNVYDVPHTSGIFFFNTHYAEIANKRETFANFSPSKIISVDSSGKFGVNSLKFTAYPDSGKLAFEIIREKDKGVFAYHSRFNIRKFSASSLDISDILAAYYAGESMTAKAAFARNGINIMPNPAQIINGSEDLYIYFEIYNLQLNKEGLAEYEQEISVLPEGYQTGFSLKNAANSVAEFFGLKEKEQIIRLASVNVSRENDPSVYLQLDISAYKPGSYDILIEIEDKVSGVRVSGSTRIIKR
ncbi:MAG TPA: GWxTD domain-containing protein, partial [Ignavibacteriales bacterium]|nr:GWxTD domain-containing protein [Ignavibacteriales bacterium]